MYMYVYRYVYRYVYTYIYTLIHLIEDAPFLGLTFEASEEM